MNVLLATGLGFKPGDTRPSVTEALACEPQISRLLESALAEDIGAGDITSDSVVPENRTARAAVLFKEKGVVAGLPFLRRAFESVDPGLSFRAFVADGFAVSDPPFTVCTVEGPARSILKGERTALNLMQRLSAVATMTRRFVEIARPCGIEILDTRKTTPGMRLLEKYAVAVGGGVNHRLGLWDAILIKDNHIGLAGGVGPAVRAARLKHPGMKIEVETTTEDEVTEALAQAVDVILLDNMGPDAIRRAVSIIQGRAHVEVSGGVTLENLRDYLIPGVDAISVGALTHSAGSIDISLEVEI